MSDETARIEAEKLASTFQLLFKAARLVNQAALDRIGEKTGMTIKPSHTNLFPHIDFEGTRISDLAERLGVSKQAVSQLVDELEAMGGLQRVPDPSDGRARLVKFREGAILDGLKELRAFEEELAGKIGKSEMENLRITLKNLVDILSC